MLSIAAEDVIVVEKVPSRVFLLVMETVYWVALIRCMVTSIAEFP